jgi:hypothetical protein
MVSKLSEYDPGCSFRIRIPYLDPDFLPIPDPGVKKAPNPGSRIRIRNTVSEQPYRGHGGSTFKYSSEACPTCLCKLTGKEGLEHNKN